MTTTPSRAQLTQQAADVRKAKTEARQQEIDSFVKDNVDYIKREVRKAAAKGETQFETLIRYPREVQAALPEYAIVTYLHAKDCERDHYSPCYGRDEPHRATVVFDSDDAVVRQVRRKNREHNTDELDGDEEGGTIFEFNRFGSTCFKRPKSDDSNE